MLGGVGTCLGLILDELCLEMSKDSSCLCFYMCRLEPMYATWTHAYVGLFLRLCVRWDGPAYAGSCPHMWALTCVHEMLGRGLTLPIFTSFSTISLLYATLTPLFIIFSSEHHYILLLSLFLHQKHHFSTCSLESRI